MDILGEFKVDDVIDVKQIKVIKFVLTTCICLNNGEYVQTK